MTNTAVNPHFHPFKDKEQFNAHASVKSNNKVNSIVFLELVKITWGKLKYLYLKCWKASPTNLAGPDFYKMDWLKWIYQAPR